MLLSCGKLIGPKDCNDNIKLTDMIKLSLAHESGVDSQRAVYILRLLKVVTVSHIHGLHWLSLR